MKKGAVSLCTVIAMALSSGLHADNKEVGKASEDSVKAAKSKKWQNIALAGAAVAVAVIAIIVVGRNHGKSSHHHHGKNGHHKG